MARSSARPVISTPSLRPLRAGSSEPSGTASSARWRLSATSSTSRAKPEMAKVLASPISRWVRAAQVLHLGRQAQGAVLGLGGVGLCRLRALDQRVVRVRRGLGVAAADLVEQLVPLVARGAVGLGHLVVLGVARALLAGACTVLRARCLEQVVGRALERGPVVGVVVGHEVVRQ